MEYLIVGIGGAAGSIARYCIGRVISEKTDTIFPIATFLINITGAFLLGMVNSLGLVRDLSLLFADGFLGAYTTFSTFMYEGFNLFQENEKGSAFKYVLGSLVLGIIGFIIGIEAGKLLKNIF
ncbi:MAG: fluoride efflux transporter CrcB [Bacillota bacterium]|nr:fluoride efflux transporter CrcB [Bacillota bacterium]